MVGRAGRPRYDKVGISVLIAKNNDERDYLFESYVLAKPERIWSKLGVERVLRSHVLATVASEYAYTEQGVYEFFEGSFYAYQYDLRMIKGVIARILRFLYKEGMLNVKGQNLHPTDFGRRVSQLYIDPLSAIIIREGFNSRAENITDISFLHLIAHTPDMYPKLHPLSRELDSLSAFAEEHRDEIMINAPEEWSDRYSYEEFLGEIKTVMVLKSWIEEESEDRIIERFNVEPGDLYRLIEAAKWLLYASHELAILLKHKDLVPKIYRLMKRVEKGVKEELLPLASLEGIGRIRARILFNAGYRRIEDLRRARIKELMNLPMIGPGTAKKIKEQVGGFIKSKEWKNLSNGREEQQSLTEYYR